MADNRTRPRVMADHPWLRRFLIACVAIVLFGLALQTIAQGGVLLSSVLTPVALAVLLTGLLMPIQVLLNRTLRLPRSLAAALVIVGSIAAIVALMWVAGRELAAGIEDIQRVAGQQLQGLGNWVVESTPVGREQIADAVAQLNTWLQDNQGRLVQGAAGVGASAASFFVSAVLALMALFFFLSQGDRIWSALVLLLPHEQRRPVYEASRRGWVTLSTYCRTQLIVAGVDAVAIGAGAALLGVPFALPLTAITFVLCFVPFVGAILSGALAVLLGLAFSGWTTALIMLVIVVAVQQLESNVLSPLIMGKAVDVHPLLILIIVLTATYMAGIAGALFAVPMVATVKSMSVYLSGRDPFPNLATGGRALTGSPRKLVGDHEEPRMPSRIGDATLTWLAGEMAEKSEPSAELESSLAPDDPKRPAVDDEASDDGRGAHRAQPGGAGTGGA